MQTIKKFFNLPFFTKKKYIISIWFIIAIGSSIKQYLTRNPDNYNNYSIYKNVFFHTIHKLPLYTTYTNEYFDHNHYGPIFSIIIAPFAIFPDWLGMTLWSAFNAAVILYAINKLPLKYEQINLILWIGAHEFLTSILSFQFNTIMTAIIILSYVLIKDKKDFWAAMLIMLGTFVKLYGIVGLAFFFFSKDKVKFIGSLIFWAILFFVLPMLLSSPEFILNTYVEWYERLVLKNSENASLTSMQDISFMGMYRRILHNPELPNLPFLLFGLTLFGLPYLKISSYKKEKFQLLLLSSVLIFTVIFSSGSESPTYIIAFLGVAIWFVLHNRPRSNRVLILFIFALILTSFSPSDIIPKFLRENYIIPYALKALPCVLIWFSIIYEMIFFKQSELEEVNTIL
jgi:hypothetical protein